MQLRLLKNFKVILEETLKNALETFTSYNLYLQDESRYGLFTRNGRAF